METSRITQNRPMRIERSVMKLYLLWVRSKFAISQKEKLGKQCEFPHYQKDVGNIERDSGFVCRYTTSLQTF